MDGITMTVIAWDGHTLAADTGIGNGGIFFKGKKIFEVADGWIAVFGNYDHAIAVVQWYNKGAKPTEYPPFANDDSCEFVHVNRKGELRLYNDTQHVPVSIDNKSFAFGSGREFAIAGMHLGLSAEEAVKLACKFRDDCRLPLNKVVVKQLKKTK